MDTAGGVTLDGTGFAALMAPLGPFEPAPRLAVAVSGGADSLALALLAADWARARGGSVTALTVDHGLRPEAAAETARVAAWMASAGIPQHTLVWTGPKPAHGVQAAARAARLALLEGWCRAHGVLDLLLAHHRDDQAETVLLRLGQGSGPDGLAAMAPVTYRPSVRVLRPLLTLPGAVTRATLRARGHPWIEDPSNRDRTFQRVRLRRVAPALAEAGVGAAGLVRAAARAAERRAEATRRLNARLARALVLAPTGHARVDLADLLAPPDSEARAALGRLLACVGGAARPPREAPLARALARLRGALGAMGDAGGAGLTLGRCRVLPDPRGRGWLVVREARHWPPPQPLRATEALWDGRFVILDGGARPAPDIRVVPLATVGWSAVAAARRAAGLTVPGPDVLPSAARAGLPVVVSDRGEVLADACAPGSVRYAGSLASPGRADDVDTEEDAPCWHVRFAPRLPLTAPPTRLASARDDPM
ncbi:tRNA lysidine(34) synthetase TilS [Roseospira visakhapatnamensis]|uniref:tRNA(Ile)-lysidine synthase n=1 Tax=Roseospira visakhapatnamensis TaxID=390880 RepID=A0A7W6WAT2_9PROT|nr:tRNA lysidine(34) synthetase TilS [Roseospira visakhapatnamensis]MBB4267289.1 tRNA(Ile)-lysidine synthase [Roseospira visakhapatnamensis]